MTSIQQPPPKGSKSKAEKPLKSRQNATFIALEWVAGLHLKSTDKALLYALARRVNKDFECWPGRELLAKEAGIKNIVTVTRHINKLGSQGLILVTKEKPDHGGWSFNKYRLLIPAKIKAKGKNDADQYVTISTKPYVTISPEVVTNNPEFVINSHTNYTENYSKNSPEGIDNQQDETSEATASQDIDPEVSGEINEDQNLEYDLEMQKQQEAKKQNARAEYQKKLACHFPVAVNYQKPKLTANAMVSFWWSCIERYHPTQYSPDKKFTTKQSGRLWELFGMFDKHQRATVVIEWSIKHWDTVSERALAANWMSKPPQSPTPTWMVANLEHCTDYYYKSGPIKLGTH